VLTPINSFITDDTNEATRLNRLTGSKGKTAIAMPNAVLISERITCLKLYRQVFQGLKAHCYRIINCTTMVRFEIILGICFVVWTVLEKVSDRPYSLKAA